MRSRGDQSAGGDLYRLHREDARNAAKVLSQVATGEPCVMTTITSPPYGDLIDYGGTKGQIGFGQTYEEYLRDCQRIFGQILRYTMSEGSMWLIADTFYDQSVRPSRLRPLPFDLAHAAELSGWVLREVVIWDKEKTRPWSGRGRMRNAFEYILLFVKSEDFKYHVDRLRDPIELTKWWVQYPERYNPQGKAPTNLWRIPIPNQGTWSTSAIQHACPLPPDLVERLVYLSTDEGDLVLDPFAGSGTVIAEAFRLGRRSIGFEINETYIEAYEKLVLPEITQRRGADLLTERLRMSKELQTRILKLRAMKYPKKLSKALTAEMPDHGVQCAVALVRDPAIPRKGQSPHQLLQVDTIFVCEADPERRDDLQRRIKEFTCKKPFTGYGVGGDVSVVDAAGLKKILGKQQLHLYEHGRTWRTTGLVTAKELLAVPVSDKRGGYMPVAGNVELLEDPERPYA